MIKYRQKYINSVVSFLLIFIWKFSTWKKVNPEPSGCDMHTNKTKEVVKRILKLMNFKYFQVNKMWYKQINILHVLY